MTAYQGGIAGHLTIGLQTYGQSDIFQERLNTQEEQEHFDIAHLPMGDSTNTQPVGLVSDIDRDGSRIASFFEDFYNRVYFIPPSLDLGAVSTEVEAKLKMWNAHLQTRTLQTIDATGDDGLAITITPRPFDILPLSIIDYTITASLAGPPSINANYEFVFDNRSYFLPVIGTRSKLGPLTPTWDEGYEIQYEFKTEVFTSYNGTEQRRALRETPRKKISYTAHPHHEQLRRWNDLMFSWQGNTINIPELPRKIKVLGQIIHDDTLIPLLYIPHWMVPGQSIMVISGDYNILTSVKTTSPGLLELQTSVGVDLPPGAFIHPVVSGLLAKQIKSTRLTNMVATVKFELEITPASELDVGVQAADETFNGHEIFTVKPNWATSPDMTYESYREMVDFGRGRWSKFDPIPYRTQTLQFYYSGKGYAGARDMLDLFQRMKGQRGDFYMPDWEADIQMKGIVPATTKAIRVEGRQFLKDYQDDTIHRAIAVNLRDGTTYYRKVDTISPIEDDDGFDTTIQLTETFPEELTVFNVKTINWMPLWRFATDTLTIQWLTDEVWQCTFTLKTLEDYTT